jgi:hypothetical protein
VVDPLGELPDVAAGAAAAALGALSVEVAAGVLVSAGAAVGADSVVDGLVFAA